MHIKWYGHASFRIRSSDGVSVITDPYTPESSGYPPITDTPELVIISSDNDSFHCRADLIPGDFETVNALELARAGGERVVQGIPIRAIEAMEALNHRYHDPDQNGMYRFMVDGIHVGHMGDVGNPLSAAQVEFFRGLDLFFVLTGGHPTIELDDLRQALDAIQPRLVIPMHFRTLTYKPRNVLWLQSFLDYFDPAQVDFACHYESEITPTLLPDTMRVLVLDYARGC